MVVGSLDIETELAIIGAGPGGYTAALRAAKAGKEVTVVDAEGELGGVCLHHGCIPTKSLIHSSDYQHVIEELEHHGIQIDSCDVCIEDIQKSKDETVQGLNKGLHHLFDSYGIELIKGRAEFKDEHTLHLSGQSDVTSITFEEAIIATGGKPIELPFLPYDEENILSSRELLEIEEVPESLVIVGGGYIGTEMGTVFGKLGSQVTIIEQTDQLIPMLPRNVVDVVKDRLGKFNVEVELNATAKAYRDKALIYDKDGEQSVSADKVLVVVGRAPNLDGVSLENIGLQPNKDGFLDVNKHMQTEHPHIYAVGDIIGQPMLAHKAMQQGRVVAKHLVDGESAYDNMVIPAVVFNDPEIACVGHTEDEARQDGYEPITGQFSFQGSGRAHTLNKAVGFVEVVADKDTHRVLGVQSVGPDVSNMIAEATLAIEMGATLQDITRTIHAHPTIPEGLQEACETALMNNA